MSISIKKILPFFYAFLIGCVFIIGCTKELSTENGINVPILSDQTSIEGRVIDESGMPVVGANEKAGLSNTTTDKNGMFKITNAVFSTTETFVTVTKPGYFKGSRTFFSRDKSNNYLKIQLLRKAISGRISSSAGGDVEVRGGGGNVHFEANSFVTAAGSNYLGTVLVATQYLDPTLDGVSDQMPGDLRGTNTAGNVVGLKSYGMIAVELLDENGQTLQLKSGLPATLQINIPASKTTTAPATIPLWYFNDTTGLWKQEGVATKVGTQYEGTVAHFSFWNCDDPFVYVKLKARFINNAGLPIATAKVLLIDQSGYSAYDYTDNNGYVDGFVPQNQSLALKVINACGQVIYTNNVGPFTAQTDLGNITINQGTSTIYGTAVNCANAPITDGYVQLLINGSTQFAGITNGSFSYTYISCQGVTSAEVIAVDNAAQKQGNPINISLNSASVNAGQLVACAVSSNTFFNLIINGTTYSANTSNFYRYGWKDSSYNNNTNTLEGDYIYAAYDSVISKYIYAAFTLPYNQVFTTPYTVNAGLDMGYMGLSGASEEVSLTPINPISNKLIFTTYGGLGQFIQGSFSGLVQRNRYDSVPNTANIDTVNISMSFRVRNVTPPF